MPPSPYWPTVAPEAQSGDRHFSPSAARNTEPIVDVLSGILSGSGNGLEVASGTGQHAVSLARAFPALHWTPSDPDPAARASIEAHRLQAGLENLQPPRDVDLTQPDWAAMAPSPLAVLVAINVIHISPWAATLGLLDGAVAALRPGGLLFAYGCFSRNGDIVSDSNAAFDASLRARNPLWGVRDTADVTAAATAAGLSAAGLFEMPANNTALAFRR